MGQGGWQATQGETGEVGSRQEKQQARELTCMVACVDRRTCRLALIPAIPAYLLPAPSPHLSLRCQRGEHADTALMLKAEKQGGTRRQRGLAAS